MNLVLSKPYEYSSLHRECVIHETTYIVFASSTLLIKLIIATINDSPTAYVLYVVKST